MRMARAAELARAETLVRPDPRPCALFRAGGDSTLRNSFLAVGTHRELAIEVDGAVAFAAVGEPLADSLEL